MSADEYARLRADLKDEARLTLKDLTVDKPLVKPCWATRRIWLTVARVSLAAYNSASYLVHSTLETTQRKLDS